MVGSEREKRLKKKWLSFGIEPYLITFKNSEGVEEIFKK